MRQLAGQGKNKNPKDTEGKAQGSASRALKAAAKAAAAGPTGPGVALVWVVVVLALLLVGGIYIIVHSAGTVSRLSNQISTLERRAQEAQRKQLLLAADYAEEAARYATEENYGLKDEAAANAEKMVTLAASLAEEAEAATLLTTLDRLKKARTSRGSEVSSQLRDIATALRALAPTGVTGAAPTPEKALPQPPLGRTQPAGR